MFYCYYQFLMDPELDRKQKHDDFKVDSDDEYHAADGGDFTEDSLVGKPKIESKQSVLNLFKFFLTLNDQLSDPYARKDYLNKIN